MAEDNALDPGPVPEDLPERCGMCRHPVSSHDVDPETGFRPCRSVGHSKGLPCADCRRLTSPEHVEAIMKLRGGSDPFFTAAYGAFSVTEDHARQQIGVGWQAHHTAMYESAVASALLEIRSQMDQAIRAEIAASLRRAAAGRREYAEGVPERKAGATAADANLAEMRDTLLREADRFDSCALLVEHPEHVMGLIPSWRWTNDELASLDPAKETTDG